MSPTIQANSNRVPAGKLENGILTLHLELRQGDWHPEADSGPSMKVYAFGEEGQMLQVPGPLIRVSEGGRADCGGNIRTITRGLPYHTLHRFSFTIGDPALQ